MNQIPFNADEIFEIAMQIERNGVRYYTIASQKSKLSDAKEMLEMLAEMEKGHEKTFGAMKQIFIGKEIRPSDVQDRDDLASGYLRSIAKGYVFDIKSDPAAMLEGDVTLPEVLEKAISLEKEAIIFYLGIQQNMYDDDDRKQVDRIIHEEMGHIVALTKAIENLDV